MRNGAVKQFLSHVQQHVNIAMLLGLACPTDFWFVSRKPAVDDVGNPSSVNAR